MTTPISPLPTPPSPADSPVDFNTKAFALLGALPAFVTESNAQASGLDAAVAAAGLEADAAALKAGEALASANNAALSKTGADSARDASVAAKNAAEAALDSFDDRYLGAKAVAPTTDNDGGALLPGALYWDTVLGAMRAWSGSVWVTLPATTAAAISNTPAGSIAATTVQAALNELDAEKIARTDVYAAGIPNTPAGSITATTVQAAINELDSEKVAKTAVIAIANGGTGATTANAAADAIGAFRRGTLLGTVSQSAGVPTGAVIERGSNANGQYVRFADGTQICTHFVSVSGASAVSGQIFVSQSNTWTFPAVFANTPAFYANEIGGNGSSWAGLGGGAASNTGAPFSLFRAVAATIPSDVTLCAIGRWF